MTKMPKRVVPTMYEFCGKYQAVSDYYKTGYFDTEKEARKNHNKMIAKFRMKGLTWG